MSTDELLNSTSSGLIRACIQGPRFEPELVVVSPGKAAKINEVDGITGATLSCKAFEKILNSESKRCLPLLGEAGE